MLLILPLATFGLLWLLVARHRARLGMGGLSVRGALVLAFLAFELLVLLVTYGLSFVTQFTRGAVVGAWSLALVLLVWAARRPLRDGVAALRAGSVARSLRRRGGDLGTEDRIWLAVLAVVVVVVAVVAFRYLPSSSDAMSYHLVRVEYWIQNRSVAPFATHYLPQVEFGPLAEYDVALVRLLGATDRIDAAVELLSMVVCLVGASEVARLLGGSRRSQLAAAVVCATLPSGILLASSTENNYVAAAVAVVVVVVVLAFSFRTGFVTQSVVLGLAFGTAYVTKAIVPAMLLPVAVVFLGHALYRDLPAVRARRRAWAGRVAVGVGACALAAAAVAVPFAAPLAQLDGSLIGGPESSAAASSPWSVRVGAANIVRNVANEFHVGNGHSGVGYALSRTVLPALGSVFDALHVPADDPRFAVTPGDPAFAVQSYSGAERTEEAAADPLHLLLVVAAVAVLVVAVVRRSRWSRRPAAFALGLGCGYVLFTATAKWGLWDVRYDLPLFVAWSAVIGVVLARGPAWILRVTLVVLVVAALPQLVDNAARPLVTAPAVRPSAPSYLAGYLTDCCASDPAGAAASYDSAATVLTQSSCREVTITNWIEFEYPLWVALRRHGWTGRLDQTDVGNYTSALERHRPGCASLSQEPTSFHTPDDGSAWVQFGGLVVSVRPGDARTVRRMGPHFSSTVAGVGVFAGGGWRPVAFFGFPVLERHGTVYLTSGRSGTVRLELVYPPGAGQAPVAARLADGTALPTRLRGTTEEIGVAVRPGVTRVDLTVTPTSTAPRDVVVLHAVTVAGPSTR